MKKNYVSALLVGMLTVSAMSTVTSCKDYDDDISAVQGQVNDANAVIKTLQAQLEALKTANANAQASADAAKLAAEQAAQKALAAQQAGDKANAAALAAQAAAEVAKKAAADAQTAAIAEATKKVEELKTQMQNLLDAKLGKEEFALKEAALKDELNKLAGTISGINTELAGRIAELDGNVKNNANEISNIKDQLATLYATKEDLEVQKAALDNFKQELTETTIPGIKELIKTNATAIDQLSGKVEAQKKTVDELLASTADLPQIRTQIQTLTEALNAVKKEIETNLNTNVSTLHTLVTQRLTSLVFMPQTYVGGIETIKFASLTYFDWADDFTRARDFTAQTENIINDTQTTATYALNPSGVDKESIADVGFIAVNNAENVAETRAMDADNAPVKTTAYKVEDGKLAVTLAKKSTDMLSNNPAKFTIVALKVKLADKVLTKDEQGKSVFVYSDWTRLYETKQRPFLHDAKKVAEDGKPLLVWENGDFFYDYATVYGGQGKAADQTANADNFIASKQYFKESINLETLVNVLDKTGTEYGLSRYNLEYNFSLEPYKVGTVDQSSFATLEGSVLKAKNPNGTQLGVAIGHTPLIMVQLIDKATKKVVDVAYFKVKWTDKQETRTFDVVAANEQTYGCGDVYTVNTKGADFSKMTEAADMSFDEFKAHWTLSPVVYTDTDLADDHKAQGAAIALNGKELKLTNLPAFSVTEAEYDAKKTEKVYYGVFTNNLNPELKYIFPVKVTYAIPQMTANADYDYFRVNWEGLNGANYADNGLTSTTKTRIVNPILEDDLKFGTDKGFERTQITGALLYGYQKSGTVAGNPKDLVKGASGVVRFVFDESEESKAKLAAATDTKAEDWTVSSTKRTLSYKGTYAATIDVDGSIHLEETPRGVYGKASSAAQGVAKRLIGKSVTVKLVAEYCPNGFEKTFDKFQVKFLTPLAMTLDKAKGNLSDQTNANVKVRIDNLVNITEAFRKEANTNRVLYKASENKLPALSTWYGVEDILVDVPHALCNIQSNTSVGTTFEKELSEFKKRDGTPMYVLNYTDGYVAFMNNSGNAIAHDFQVKIPVIVKTRWQEFTDYIVLDVKKNI